MESGPNHIQHKNIQIWKNFSNLIFDPLLMNSILTNPHCITQNPVVRSELIAIRVYCIKKCFFSDKRPAIVYLCWCVMAELWINQ